MKSRLGVALLCLLGGPPAAMGQVSRDAVAVDPAHHRVVMENDHVRVFEALAAPGARSPMHTHPPFVLISYGTARFRVTGPDGAAVIFDLHPGQALWLESVEHSWELLSGQLHVIAVEPKAAQRGQKPTPVRLRPTDAVTVDPTHHHLVMENDYVRVFEVRAAPGAKSPMHTHPPLVAVSLGDARSRMGARDGTTAIFDLYPGQVLWMENVEHSWEVLSGRHHVFAVEIKGLGR